MVDVTLTGSGCTETSTSSTLLTATLSELLLISRSNISESLMELTSDIIRTELVDELSSHVYNWGMIVVQWRVPWLAD